MVRGALRSMAATSSTFSRGRGSDIVRHPHNLAATPCDLALYERLGVAQIEPFPAVTMAREDLVQLALHLSVAGAVGPKVQAVGV